MKTATRQPSESTMPFYHHAQVERRGDARPAVRWVKVAWLGSLLSVRGQPAVRLAAASALTSIDNDNPRNLVAALRLIARSTTSEETGRLANDAAAVVERAI